MADHLSDWERDLLKQRREREIEAEVQRRLDAKLGEAAAEVKRKALPRRSQMDAKAIARFLEANGREAFEALPR
jgi:hypothetical protein